VSVKVDLSIGEHCPHLFVSTDPEDIRWARTAEGSKSHTVIELSDTDWASWREAEDRYYQWVEKLDARRKFGGRS
jgi:hypothetical protein